MRRDQLLEFCHSIRCKLLFALFCVLALSLGAAMLGIWQYEKDKFIEISHDEAMRAGRTIEKALRASMLKNDRRAIQKSIDEISEIVEPPSRLSIVANDGTVAFSSEDGLLDRDFDRFADPTCSVCHQQLGVTPERSSIVLSTPAGPMVRNIIAIQNHSDCYPCHPASQENLGILLYDAFLQETYDLLHTVEVRTLITGILTFLVIIAVLSYLITRLIHRPIQALITGFHHVGDGDFSYWVEVQGSSEFAEMADSFNVMNRAIGRYIEEVKMRNRETATLYAVVQRMSRTIELKELINIVFDLFYEFFEFEEILLVRLEEQRRDSFLATWRQKESSRLHHTRYSLETPEFPHPLLTRTELQQWLEGQITQPTFQDRQSRILIPLAYSNTRMGLICIRPAPDRQLSPPKKKLITALANHVAISFANARLYHLATTDGLTGLYTKRYFRDNIARMTEPGPASASPFWVMMLDLDHFKEVNDTYGHPAGDRVLMELADIIRDNIRYGDIPCRYGGEEFIVLLPDISGGLETVRSIAERLRRSVEAHTFTCPDCPPINRTISIGIASFPDHADTAEELIRAVDSALYAAKRDGRNRIKCAPAGQGG